MTVTTPPCIYPLPAHVVGRPSNLQTADFGAFIRHQLYDTSFIRLFAAPCQSLRRLLLAYFGFPALSVLVRLIWSFPTLESLMLQHCAWVISPTDILPDPALHPRHVSKLTHLQLWLDFAASTPLPLAPFGTNLTMLEIDALLSFATTADYKGIAALEKLVTFVLRVTKDDISVLPTALSHIRSPALRCLVVVHRVEEQTPETTARQLRDACNFPTALSNVLGRSTFWSLLRLEWAVRCKAAPGEAEQEKWTQTVTPFVQVMADRKVLHLTIEEGPKQS